MTTFLSFLLIIGGFFLLIKGADWLVEGGTTFARKFGVSDLVIGLTIVSFGTSAPELIVNIIASMKGSADIAIANIVGSNISNTLLILGATATITPLAVQKSTVFKEVPFCLLATILLFIFANDNVLNGYPFSELSRSEGMAFIGFFAIFMYYIFGIKNTTNHEEHTQARQSLFYASVDIIVGMIALAVGGDFAVRGAIVLAENMGLSEKLIGLTIVALGTSLPELTTSIAAALKHKPDISVGNIIGSNIFNIFWILGISSIIHPIAFDPALNFDLIVVIASTIALFFFIHTGHIHHRILFWKQKNGHVISKLEGWSMLACYIVYIGFISWRG